jgi:hypothetical protein
MEALKDIPEIEVPLLTEQGEARLQKTDIFRRIMWFGYKEDNNWYPLRIERVNEILELNRAGKKPASLEIDKEVVKEPLSKLNSDLESMDKKFQSKSKKKKKNRSRGKDRLAQNQPAKTPQARNNPKGPRKE